MLILLVVTELLFKTRQHFFLINTKFLYSCSWDSFDGHGSVILKVLAISGS